MDTFLKIKSLFDGIDSPHTRYQKIIDLGKSLPEIPEDHKTDANIVRGCQSIVYLHSELKDGKLFFTASSEALISSGLAALLIMAYNGKSPEEVIKIAPSFLEELQIPASLSPGRSNGLASMYLRMQKDALQSLIA